jgi:hypothetical protein
MSDIQQLEAAGWATDRWAKMNYRSDGTFTNPLLLALAHDRDYSATTYARKAVMNSDQYKYAADGDVQNQLFDAAKPKAMQKRVQAGKDFRSVARQLGHVETDGKFAFESKTRRQNRFNVGDCILCGISGHGVVSCREYGNAKTWKRQCLQRRQVPAHGQLVNYGHASVYYPPTVNTGPTTYYNLPTDNAATPQSHAAVSYNAPGYDPGYGYGYGSGYANPA